MRDVFAMNTQIAPGPRADIVLAQEKPFRLASTQVRPASLEVEFQSRTASLEPRVMKVLVALGRMGGEPVSREMLIDCCWAGRVVTDGALNRAIAQLRKTLRDPQIRIETIPTVGYRLQAGDAQPTLVPEISRIEESPAAAPVQASPARARRPMVLLAIGAVVLASAMILWRYATPGQSVIWTASQFRPLTATAEQETFPALSPAGTQIAYAIRPDAHSSRELNLLTLGTGARVRLTSDPNDDYGPAWSPDGLRLAFVRSTPREGCVLVVVPVPLGPERVVTRCIGGGELRPSWLDARTLVFSDRTATEPLPRIRAVDIETGALRDLTSPSLTTLGDTDPYASPDGRQIAFRRALAPGADDLVVLDSRTGRESVVTTDGWKASSYVWSSDSRYIFFASNRGGDFGLWSVDSLRSAPPRRVSLGLGTVSFMRMSADRQNRIAVEFARGQNKLARWSSAGNVAVLTAGNGWDGDPAVSSTGSVAHVSNRGGSFEVWLLGSDGAPSRLTSIEGSYVLEPSWSTDANTITFVGVRGRRAEIYTIGRDGAGLRQHTDDGIAKRDPVFYAADKRLRYLQRANGRWRLMELELGSSVPPRALSGGEGWVTLRSSPSGTIFGLHERSPFVQVVNPPPREGSGVIPPELSADTLPRISGADSWTVGADGIYVRRGSRVDQVSSLWFFPWHGPERKLAEVPLASGNIAVDPDGNVLFSQNTTMEVDLAMIELRAQE
jgi:Tol biopolymer transport system component/DNA-binding winged helix-turn-helix (wHTH) protein